LPVCFYGIERDKRRTCSKRWALSTETACRLSSLSRANST